jgi:hypothetical protein
MSSAKPTITDVLDAARTDTIDVLPAPERSPKARQSHDVVRLLPAPTPRVKLSTPRHVAREMAQTYRAVKCGRLDSAEGSKRVFMLSQLSKVLETANLEARIEALEHGKPADED